VIITVAATHFLFAWLKQKSPAFGKVLDGTPLVLLSNGQWQVETMKSMALSDDDVMAAARDKGLKDLSEIEYAILERNGEISILEASK
jgi:uncharacterized membrane protein YcaP (DUF421 family)